MLSRHLLSVAAFGISLLAPYQGVQAFLPPNIEIVQPTFQPLYDGILVLTPDVSNYFVPGPFGDRGIIRFLGGNLTNSVTGELEADILPGIGGEFGVQSASNSKFYPDATFALQWTDDKTYAYMTQQGVATVGTDLTSGTTYTRIETNSASRQRLTETVLLFSIAILSGSSTPTETISYFRIFEKTSPDPTVVAL